MVLTDSIDGDWRKLTLAPGEDPVAGSYVHVMAAERGASGALGQPLATRAAYGHPVVAPPAVEKAPSDAVPSQPADESSHESVQSAWASPEAHLMLGPMLGGLLLLETLSIAEMIRWWRRVVTLIRARHPLIVLRGRNRGFAPSPVGPGGVALRLPGQPPVRGTRAELRDLGWKVRTLEEFEDDVEFELLVALHMAIYARRHGERALDILLDELQRCVVTLQGFVTELFPRSSGPLTPTERALYYRLRDKVADAANRRKYR